MSEVAVLFARSDSIYKTISGCDVWDIDRDARNFNRNIPIIGHPPCRAWGRLRAFAKPRHDEKQLAVWCVDQIRKNGGVLEHPFASSLWKHCQLPRPNEGIDNFGGFTLDINQSWWGHKADKRTWLYICGIAPKEIPQIPYSIKPGTHVVSSSRKKVDGKRFKERPELSKADRERTPLEFAKWLIELARMTKHKESPND